MSRKISEIITNTPVWTDEQEALIMGPFNYLSNTPGKHIRTHLIQVFNQIYEIPETKIIIISRIIEMLHTSSLLIDDIEDGSNLRRGKPTAHLIFGTPYVINSSSYINFRSFEELMKLESQEAVSAFNEELLNLHRGQSMDLYWRDNLTIPTEEEYLNMVKNKTGGLFRLAIRLMELFTNHPNLPTLVPLVNLLGVIYQIKDDYLNLTNTEFNKNKGFCEDITEGKFSFPIIHSLKTSDDKTLLGILKQRTENDDIKRFALTYLEKTKSFEYCLDVLKQVKDECFSLIESLDLLEEKKAALRAVIEKLSI